MEMEQDNLDNQMEQQPLSESPEQTQVDGAGETPRSEQGLDEILEGEREEISEIDEANAESDEEEEAESDGDDEQVESEDDEQTAGEYKPSTKYKVLDEEHDFDPKLKKFLTKETEPIIRELYEKAHGIDTIKVGRFQAITERNEIQGNYNNLLGEVGRIMNYRRSGDLQSFFESVQLPDDTIAKYILEKAQIAQLPPEQQAVYNEREAFRRRMNTLEQNFQVMKATGDNSEVQARVSELDSVLKSSETSRIAKDFDSRNGEGSFKQAVMEHGAAKFYATKKDLSAAEAVESFIKMTGMKVSKGQPKPGANATKRVVARPQVKTIPNYGGGQASVTATKKPKSVDDLRKLAREFNS